MKSSVTGLAQWKTRQWVLAITALLLLTLTPLVWIQWQQFQVMQNLSTHQVDSLTWQAYQLERETARLSYAVHITTHEHPDLAAPVDADELLQRYEVFLSRIKLIEDLPRRNLLDNTTAFREAMREIKVFNAYADPLFADATTLVAEPARLRDLSRRVEALSPYLAELTREATRAASRFMDERNRQLHDQSLLVIALAAVQTTALLVFVVVLVRHVRWQQRQYARLQELSHEVSRAKDAAEAANHGKSVFLANMSHEIRTPFQGVLGMLNLLDDTPLSGQQRDYVQTARDSAQHLLGVLNDILDVSTMESGTLRLSVAPTQLREVAQDVEGLMRAPAREKGLSLNVSVDESLPSWVMADATRLRQILFNLIGNAIKFTNAGSITAEIGRWKGEPDGVTIVVRDTGIGMDEETLSQLFTRFYQADNSLRRRVGGTGLGLEISRNLARMMGGDIAVTSAPGHGSAFTVTLRLAQTQAPNAKCTHQDSPSRTRRLKVLVAEDHPINLKYMNILLDQMGHDAVFCENGQEALELLKRQMFDAVLLDYHMPVLDGLATAQAIRAMPSPVNEIKIVLVTADVVNDTRKRALEVGVNAFTSKPLQMADLRRALEECGLTEPLGDAGSHPSTPDLPRHFTSGPGGASTMAPSMDPISPALLNGNWHEGLGSETSDLIDSESYTEILAMMPSDVHAELLGTLFAKPEGTVHALIDALARNDRTEVEHQAHRLKGSAMLMGFRAIVAVAARVEKLASEEGTVLPEAELTHDIQVAADSTQDAIKGFNLHPTD
ncbi:ATP-binding protein [Hydrogenophaga sp.]|uniref:ATP-binding protein n=1 Tax=Hydrogenophaga sp. TaxID=1904254 RepID=UPI0035B2D1E7